MRRAWAGFALALALSVAAEPFVAHEAVFEVERLVGWNALYGFLACAGLVIAAKAIGWALKRPDDHYGG